MSAGIEAVLAAAGLRLSPEEPVSVSPDRRDSRPGLSLAEFLAAAHTEPPDLFAGLIARGSNVWAGAPRSLKSMAAITAMLAVASGQPFLDREPSRTGDVLYVAEEGGRKGIAARFEALCRTYRPVHDIRLLHREGITFRHRWELVETTLGHMSAPVLVVLDTYSRLNELDENGSAAAHEALTAMSRLTRNCGVDVLLIHHTGHEGTRIRGHSSLKAGVDGTVIFKRHGMTNRLDLDAETKDTDPETLRLEWDPETFLLSPREAGSDSVDRLVEVVERLGGRYDVVRTKDITARLSVTRQWAQRLAGVAVSQGRLVAVKNGPQSGYRLPAEEEVGSSTLQ